MASTWGAAHGDKVYDAFRTGMTFRQVRQMRGPNDDIRDDRERHRGKRRRGVLGTWHELKLVAYLCRFARPDRHVLWEAAPERVRRQLLDMMEAA